MVEELLTNGSLNDLEDDILTQFGHLPAYDIAKQIKSGNYLSTFNVDVCHKIPINSFQVALCEVMNLQKANNTILFTDPMWDDLKDLYIEVMSGFIASPSSDLFSLFQEINAGNDHLACTLAWNICLAFDSSHNNLYFGHSGTNSSIGQACDMHYDIFSPTVCPPTPRGPGMENLLNILEGTLNLPKTSAFIEVDTIGVHWETNSGVDGRRSQGTGSVETTR